MKEGEQTSCYTVCVCVRQEQWFVATDNNDVELQHSCSTPRPCIPTLYWIISVCINVK